jgi:hypothetical protein
MLDPLTPYPSPWGEGCADGYILALGWCLRRMSAGDTNKTSGHIASCVLVGDPSHMPARNTKGGGRGVRGWVHFVVSFVVLCVLCDLSRDRLYVSICLMHYLARHI